MARRAERSPWRLQRRALLLRQLGIGVVQRTLRHAPAGACILLGGDRGCGKSTELRALAAELRGSERFHVVQIDALQTLDLKTT